MNKIAEKTIRVQLEKAQSIADMLLESQRYDFADLVPSKLAKLAVVYAIFDKQDGSTLYVGRTKNLQQRGQIEGLLSYLLNVRYIHEEH